MGVTVLGTHMGAQALRCKGRKHPYLMQMPVELRELRGGSGAVGPRGISCLQAVGLELRGSGV